MALVYPSVNPVMRVFPNWLIIGPACYFFILPFASVAALRSIVLLVTLVCGLFFYRQLYRSAVKLPPLPLRTGIVLWGIAALASLPMAVDAKTSLYELKSDYCYSVLFYIVCYLLTTAAGPSAFRLFRTVLSFSLLCSSTLAVVSFMRNQWWVAGYFNALGEYATIAITFLPVIVTAFFPQRAAGLLTANTGERVLALATCSLAGVALFFTHSRGVWPIVVMIAVVLLVFVAIKRLLPRWFVVVGMIIALMGAWYLALQVSEQRSTDILNLHGRDQIYSVAWGEFKKRPLTGAGYGREVNRAVYRQHGMAGSEQWYARHAHNVVLSWAEQMGVLGIAAVFSIFGGLLFAFTRAFRLRRHFPDAALIGVTGIAFTLAVFAKNMIDMFFVNETLILFFGVSGIFLGYLSHLAGLEKRVN